MLHRIDQSNYSGESKNLLGKIDKMLAETAIEAAKLDVWPEILQFIPLFGLIFNIFQVRQEAFDKSANYQKEWADLTRLPYSLNDRVNWKYSRNVRYIIQDALNTNYFSVRQNTIVAWLQGKYAGAMSKDTLAAFESYRHKAILPPQTKLLTNLFLEEEKKKKPVKKEKGKVQTQLNPDPPQVIPQEEPILEPKTAVFPPPSPLQQRLEEIAAHRYEYHPRVWRWFNLKKENLEPIFSFMDNGILTYEKEKKDKLPTIWKEHTFPLIENISRDKQLRDRYILEHEPEEGPGFSLLCRLESEGSESLNGRVRIGFDEKGRILHRFLKPYARESLTAKYLKSSLGQEEVYGSDNFYKEQKENEWLRDNNLFTIEGSGLFERVRVKDLKRNLTITVVPLPAWMRSKKN